MKVLRIFLSAVMVLAVATFPACKKAAKYKVGVSVATMQEAVYTFMKKAMTDNMDKDGVELLWVSADNKEDKQISDVEDLLSRKIDVLILHAVNTGASAQLVKKAEDAGVPVVAMDRLPEGSKVACYVTADSRKVGQIQAEFLAKEIKGKGNVIILEGESGNSVARDITLGNKDILKKNPGIKVVVEQAHKSWARDLAMATVEDALTRHKNNIQGILANNSGMAMGAVQALLAQKLTSKIITVGSDADKDACAAIVDGHLTADVDKMPYELGLATYQVALKIAKKEPFQSDGEVNNQKVKVPVKLTPVRLITKENVTEMESRWGKLK